MKRTLFFLLLLAGFSCQKKLKSTEESDMWTMEIMNDEGTQIPVRINYETRKDVRFLNIINAGDTISLKPSHTSGDTIFYPFVNYNAELVLSHDLKDEITGYWINYDSDPVRKIKVRVKQQNQSFSSSDSTVDLTGHWRTKVMLPSRSYEAILLLQQTGDILTGTMRTRSGDYQYLEGRVDQNRYYLSSFSGGSVFYLEGNLTQDTLSGRMHGLAPGDRTILAVQDDEFDLPDPSSLTKVVNDAPFELDLEDETGQNHNFQDLIEGKGAVVSIFGTWCPNCVEEVDYFNEIRNKFSDIRFLFVSFETTADGTLQKERVKNFKTRKNLDFTFLIGGQVGEENVRSKFPMIDYFGAYPTTFFLDKKGEIHSVHTGFNGPATGILFDQYKKDLESKLTALVQDGIN